MTHVSFEELQPLVVFAFRFPHFNHRLDLKTQVVYVRALIQ